MRRIVHKTAFHFVGWILVAAGIVGFMIPFVPGSLIMATGIYVLSLGWLWLWTKIELLKKRFPVFAKVHNTFENKLGKYIKKVH